MRIGPHQVGPRGFLLLAATGLAGIALAVHGYGHGAVVVAGPAGVIVPAGRQPTRAAPGASSSTPTTRARRPSSKAPSSSQTPSQKLGPRLSSTQYASFAYRIYPGPETDQARRATAGFTIQVTPHDGKIDVSVSAPGSGQGAQTATYPAGDRVYFIEATFGDDSGNADYNFGDDGIVLTNAQGYLVR